VTIETLVNLLNKEASLTFFRVTIEGETSKNIAYILAYNVHRKQYNLTVITKILTVDNAHLYLTIVNIQPTSNKSKPIMDAVIVVNETTLSSYYKIVAEAVKKYLTDKESGWMWNKVSEELVKLSRLVEKELNEYDKLARGLALIADFDLWCCLASIAGLVDCILAESYLLSICPLCIQVITCIPACASIFTIWWCLGCLGTGLLGCAACVLYVATCTYAAYGIFKCCR